MMIGTVITMAPAAIDPVGSSNCELPVKLAMATGAVLTGAALFSVRAVEYSGMPIFLAKMTLILAAGLNFLIFLIADGSSGDTAGTILRLSAIVSIVLWCGVLLCGRFIGFV